MVYSMNFQACLKNGAVYEKIYYLYFTFVYIIIYCIMSIHKYVFALEVVLLSFENSLTSKINLPRLLQEHNLFLEKN